MNLSDYEYFRTDNGVLYCGDCLEIMPMLETVDMILCDLPYGTTACLWDTVIPFEPLWKQYKRIAKDRGSIVLTASQPFTTMLIASNMKMFKYCWVWVKNQPTGMASAKYQPMRDSEDCCVFYIKSPTYNKQPTKSKITDRKTGRSNGKLWRGVSEQNGITPDKSKNNPNNILKTNVNPRTTLFFNVHPRAKGMLHPTQKPVALFEYLIRTYTHEGETVLDNCAGSGTTAVACERLNRRWICIEISETYCQIAKRRLELELQQPRLPGGF